MMKMTGSQFARWVAGACVVWGSLCSPPTLAQAAECRMGFRIISDSGGAVRGLPVLFEDPNSPPTIEPLILSTNNLGVTGYCEPSEGATYLAHLSEFEGGDGFYCGTSYVVNMPDYGSGIDLGVHLEELSLNRLDQVAISPPQSSHGEIIRPSRIEPFWMIGVPPNFSASFNVWVGALYHADGIGRFLAYYGVANQWSDAERGTMIRAKNPVSYEESLLVSISTQYTSMQDSPTQPRVRAFAIHEPGSAVPPVPENAQIEYFAFEGNNVWVELKGGVREGYTVLLIEPGDGSDFVGTGISVEAYYAAVVPGFSAFEGGGTGWVTKLGMRQQKGAEGLASAREGEDRALAQSRQGDQAGKGSTLLPWVSATLGIRQDGGGDALCTPEAPADPLPTEECEPSPGWMSDWFGGWDKVGITMCGAKAYYNNNTVCVEVGPDDDPTKRTVKHTKGHRITIGGKLTKKDEWEVVPSYEYTTTKEETTETPFNTGDHGKGQCKGSYTIVTVCKNTWQKSVPTYSIEYTPEIGYTLTVTGSTMVTNPYTCEEEYVYWAVCSIE